MNKLGTYLTENNISDDDFAKKIKVSGRAVGYYKNGDRIPQPKIMKRIVKETKNVVTPNDFYGAA